MQSAGARTLTTLMLAGLLAAANAATTAAQETRRISASGAWTSIGGVVPIDRVGYEYVGVVRGVMYVETKRDWLNSAKLICSVRMGVNQKFEQEGQGRCVLRAHEGGQVYARYSCKGDKYGCVGDFIVTGGAGRFAGVTGGGKVRIRGGFSEAKREASGLVIQENVGLISWPELTIKFPKRQPKPKAK